MGIAFGGLGSPEVVGGEPGAMGPISPPPHMEGAPPACTHR